MERRPNASEVRKAEHDRLAANARELGDKALRNIDAALREQEDIWENMQRWAGCDGLDPNELLAKLWETRHPNSNGRDPDTPPTDQ